MTSSKKSGHFATTCSMHSWYVYSLPSSYKGKGLATTLSLKHKVEVEVVGLFGYNPLGYPLSFTANTGLGLRPGRFFHI